MYHLSKMLYSLTVWSKIWYKLLKFAKPLCFNFHKSNNTFLSITEKLPTILLFTELYLWWTFFLSETIQAILPRTLTVIALATGSFEWRTEKMRFKNSSTFKTLSKCFSLCWVTLRMQSRRKLLLKERTERFHNFNNYCWHQPFLKFQLSFRLVLDERKKELTSSLHLSQ